MPEPNFMSLYTVEPVKKQKSIIKVSCGIGDTDGFPAFDVDSDAYAAKDDSKWGFLITGGSEFHMPLTVFQVTPDGLADKGGIRLGDIILEINEEDATALSLAQAHEKIDSSGKKIHFLVKTMEEDPFEEFQIGEEKSIVLRVPKPMPPPPARSIERRLRDMQKKLSEIAEIPKILSSTLATVSQTFEKLNTPLMNQLLYDPKRKLSYDEDAYDYELSETGGEEDSEDFKFNAKLEYLKLKEKLTRKRQAMKAKKQAKEVTPESDYASEKNSGDSDEDENENHTPSLQTEEDDDDDDDAEMEEETADDNDDITEDSDDLLAHISKAVEQQELTESESESENTEIEHVTCHLIPTALGRNKAFIQYNGDDDDDQDFSTQNQEEKEEFLSTTFTWSIPKLKLNDKDDGDNDGDIIDDDDDDDNDEDKDDVKDFLEGNHKHCQKGNNIIEYDDDNDKIEDVKDDNENNDNNAVNVRNYKPNTDDYDYNDESANDNLAKRYATIASIEKLPEPQTSTKLDSIKEEELGSNIDSNIPNNNDMNRMADGSNEENELEPLQEELSNEEVLNELKEQENSENTTIAGNNNCRENNIIEIANIINENYNSDNIDSNEATEPLAEQQSQEEMESESKECSPKIPKVENWWPWADREKIIYKQSTCHLVTRKPLGLIGQRIENFSKHKLFEHLQKSNTSNCSTQPFLPAAKLNSH